ncbi:MAG: hypothetical protein ABSH22_04460 [Tepidisphaeraceae bacterium]|jgi:hypothetical protein
MGVIVLDNQISAAEKSACELEQEVKEPRRAMLCREIEELITSVLSIHKELNKNVEFLQDNVLIASSEAKNAPYFESIYHRFYIRLEKILRQSDWLVRSMEHLDGLKIPGVADLRVAWREVRGIISTKPEELAAAKAAREAGKAIKLSDAINELRSNS